jgi:hypothetical protein
MRLLQEASLLLYLCTQASYSIHASFYVHKTNLAEITACDTAHKCYTIYGYHLPMNPTMNTQSMGILINCSLVHIVFLKLIKIPKLIPWSQLKM